MKINASLNKRDITDAINKIKWYQSYLQWKMEQFVSELAEVGIEIAKQNILVEEDGVLKDRSNLVEFTKDVSGSVEGVTCIVTALPQPYTTYWKQSKNGKKMYSAQVNPLLMAEFGSGAKAIDGHRGTFPAQRNAFRDHWVWYDLDGEKHYSSGSEPSRPLFKAKQEMEQQILTVAKRVFGTS